MSSIEEISEEAGVDKYTLKHLTDMADMGIKKIDKEIREAPANSSLKIIKENMHNMVSYTITELTTIKGEEGEEDEKEEEELGKIWFSIRHPRSIYIGIIKKNNNNNDNQRIIWIKRITNDTYTIVPYTNVTGGRRRSTKRNKRNKRNKRRSHKHRK